MQQNRCESGLGVEQPRRVKHDLDGVRDAGTSNSSLQLPHADRVRLEGDTRNVSVCLAAVAQPGTVKSASVARTKRLSVECVLNVMEQDQDPSLTCA